MKIKSIKIKNHEILGDLFLDFTDHNGKVVDTILFAGENGCGKSKILNLIFEFTLFQLGNDVTKNDEREVVVELSEQEKKLLVALPAFSNGIQNGEINFSYDWSVVNNWGQIKMKFQTNEGQSIETHGGYVANNPAIKNIFRSIFSDVEINFTPSSISSVTATDVDTRVFHSVKSSPNLATEITQLLVDVQALDDAEFTEWGRASVGKPVDEKKLDSRMARFREAFTFMFPTKQYKKIKNDGGKKVIFEESDKGIAIDALSSGEKQIVFRGGFLLKDKKKNGGTIVIIDEPEISLHPKWQLKILEFYKRLFSDEAGRQTSQMFFATHSPFVIHNENRLNAKVIVLRRDGQGKIVISDKIDFYGWTPEQAVIEAFNVDWGDTKKPIVLTEGKSDAYLLQNAWVKLFSGKPIPWEIIPSGIEINALADFDSIRTPATVTPNLAANCSSSRVCDSLERICLSSASDDLRQ